MAPVVFLQEDEDVPSVYRKPNLKIFLKRPPASLKMLHAFEWAFTLGLFE